MRIGLCLNRGGKFRSIPMYHLDFNACNDRHGNLKHLHARLCTDVEHFSSMKDIEYVK